MATSLEASARFRRAAELRLGSARANSAYTSEPHGMLVTPFTAGSTSGAALGVKAATAIFETIRARGELQQMREQDALVRQTAAQEASLRIAELQNRVTKGTNELNEPTYDYTTPGGAKLTGLSATERAAAEAADTNPAPKPTTVTLPEQIGRLEPGPYDAQTVTAETAREGQRAADARAALARQIAQQRLAHSKAAGQERSKVNAAKSGLAITNDKFDRHIEGEFQKFLSTQFNPALNALRANPRDPQALATIGLPKDYAGAQPAQQQDMIDQAKKGMRERFVQRFNAKWGGAMNRNRDRYQRVIDSEAGVESGAGAPAELDWNAVLEAIGGP